MFLQQRTSAKAFRRVKEEEVEFVDERLQDNSYWAKVWLFRISFYSFLYPWWIIGTSERGEMKYSYVSVMCLYTLCCLQDGADSGYGAKAQEVLGQVRGR